MSRKSLFGLALLTVFSSVGVARADEIRLKDGTKITGTIVGFENDSFRVETAYGFALIRKDKVADINITAAKKEPEPKTKSALPAQPAAPPSTSIVPAVAKETSSAASASPDPNAIGAEGTRSGAISTPAGVKSEPGAAKVSSVAATQPAAPPPPPPASEPTVIRDGIRGNLYVNETYGFQMYKPPSWDLIPAARKALPDAVAALGTYDQTTLLVIGREHAKDSLDAHAASKEKALGDVYENHRVISSRHVSVAGFPAIEQHSRGTADGRDWSVTLLTLLKGSDAYTLLGMTWADSDLIQVQENVISKAVNSLTFTTQ